MPWVTPLLPFASSPSPLAAHTSYLGAVDAQDRAATQTLRYLELLAKRGPISDWDAAKFLGLERSTVNARRAPLRDRGIVVAVDKVLNEETGSSNTRWGLKR